MDASEIRQKLNSLDKAVTEIERLTKGSSPAQTATKSASKAPTLEELSIPEIKAAMEIANHQGDREMVSTLYTELNRRRN
jgi:hypothetical protein